MKASDTADGHALPAQELLRLLESGMRRGADELELLKALQRALPQPGAEDDAIGELKGLLTNAIIMRTRLGDREADLPDLLRRVVDEGRLDAVPVDEGVAHRIGEFIS